MTNNQSSPYESLVNLCYQLRHENEELLQALSDKESLVEAFEKEIAIMKAQKRSADDSQREAIDVSLTERIELSNSRLSLMQENGRLDSKCRQLESSNARMEVELTQARDQVRILSLQLEEVRSAEGGETVVAFESNAGSDVALFDAQEDERVLQLKEELKTAQFVNEELEKKISVSSNKRMRENEELVPIEASGDIGATVDGSREVSPTPFIISGDGSLLRLFESIVGYSAVRTGDTVTLISTVNPDLRLIFHVNETSGDISLIGHQGCDESAIAVLQVFNSVQALVARASLNQFKKRLM